MRTSSGQPSEATWLPTWLWRGFALAAVVAALFIMLSDLAHLDSSGDFGFTVKPAEAGGYRVATVRRDSPAARAGIVAGSRIEAASDPIDRFMLFSNTEAVGERVRVVFERRGQRRDVTLIADSGERASLFETGALSAMFAIRILFLIVGAFIIVRGAERADARALASFLVGTGYSVVVTTTWYPVPVAIAIYATAFPIGTFSLGQGVRFAAIFPYPSAAGLRRWIERIVPWLVALGVLASLYVSTMQILGGPSASVVVTRGLTTAVDVCMVIAFVVALRIGTRDASPADRERVRWLSFSFMIGFGGILIALMLQAFKVSDVVVVPFVLAIGAVPIGTAYAILRHKMLDLGFVVNRALVFGIISAFVVGAFTLLEFILGKYLTTLGHVQSAVLEALLALGIGVSLGRIHNRVDGFVDNVFFRERHLAEAALRRLAHEASYVDEPRILAERLVGAVDRHAGARGTALYLHDGNGAYTPMLATLESPPPAIGRNDPAIVRMRASGEAVDLDALSHEVEKPAVPGKIAFPMIVRGALIGAIACGAKRNLEEYAPDEQAVLAELAHAAGVAFDTLQTNALRQAFDRAVAAGAIEPLEVPRPS